MTIEFPGRPDLPDTPERAAAIQAAHAREAEVRARSVIFPVECTGSRSRPHAPVYVGELGVTDSGEAYTSSRVTVTNPTERSNRLESYSATRLPACPTCGRSPRLTDSSVLEILRETHRTGRSSIKVSQIDALTARHAEGHTSP